MKEILLRQAVLETLAISYNIKADNLTPVSGGADLNATAYKAESGNTTYFVKVKDGVHNPIVPAILKLLNTAGIQQVIQPIKTTQEPSIHHIRNFSVMVFPFVNGKNGFDCELTHLQWVNLGDILRQIHSLVVTPEIQGLIRREDFSPQWRNTIRSLYSQIDDFTPKGIASKTIQFLIDHRAVIFRLVDQAEQLRQQVQNLSPPSVLCHSDIHAGNVLINETGEIYIVDWDSPILAPKERDLMFIGGGVAGVWNQLFEEELFYEGYGPTKVNPTILSYYRHERIVEDIAVYAQELVKANSENPANELMYKQFTDMFEPGNVVEIAFKTERQK